MFSLVFFHFKSKTMVKSIQIKPLKGLYYITFAANPTETIMLFKVKSYNF